MTAIFDELSRAVENDVPAVTATVVSGSLLGGKLLVVDDGPTIGTLGDPNLDATVRVDALALLPRGKSETRTYTGPEGDVDVYIDSFLPQRRLIIIGAAHTAIPLERIAREDLDYHTTIVDAREFFATRERFPDVHELLIGWPDEILSQLPLGPQTDIVVLAHDEKFEDPAMAAVLRTPVGYIGAIGSKKTSAERVERLRAAGFSEDEVNRIHAPIGLNLGGRSPSEVAIAILAEIIAVRNGKDPKKPGSGLQTAKADAPAR